MLVDLLCPFAASTLSKKFGSDKFSNEQLRGADEQQLHPNEPRNANGNPHDAENGAYSTNAKPINATAIDAEDHARPLRDAAGADE